MLTTKVIILYRSFVPTLPHPHNPPFPHRNIGYCVGSCPKKIVNVIRHKLPDYPLAGYHEARYAKIKKRKR